MVEFNPKNVFFHFISNPENCDSGNNLNLVTYTLPKLESVKSNYDEINKTFEETKQKMDNLKEFLFYTTVGSEWLVGPDFRKPHAGIQVSGQSPSALIWSKHSVSYFLCQNIFKFFLRLFFCA